MKRNKEEQTIFEKAGNFSVLGHQTTIKSG
jgi:hypothetical protein